MDNNILPVDFDGVFRFTNPTDREFKAKWNNVEYTFPAMKTSPMVISGASPEQTQYIRKKFARELAEREFFLSEEAKTMDAKNVGTNNFRTAITYTEENLKAYTQKCLEPLESARATAIVTPNAPVSISDSSKVVEQDKDSFLGLGVPIVG